jgi:uncharacterized protein YPO0396
MSRTIRLTCIHALNWYGYRDSIPVEGNLLLAGVTGSGKSILMDLIQVVLIGDQRLVRFNQSATGDRSDRSLKGYCLGDTKQEENGVTQYMRQSAITYVALEFTWPNGKRKETWGLRIEFGSAAEAHGKVTPFLIPTGVVRSEFLDTEKRPLDYIAFKAMVESRSGRLYNEGLESYLRDMGQPPHLNFDRPILRGLLPTAMSFTFLKSFNEFARNFIIPADKLDVRDVTASYRTFIGYERDLIELNDQFERLKAIRETSGRLIDLRRDRALAIYLEAKLRQEHSVEELERDQKQLNQLREECASESKRLTELDDQIPDLDRRINGLNTVINETPDGRLYSELKSHNSTLVGQISNLSGIGKTLDDALANRISNGQTWLKDLRSLPVEMEAVPVYALQQALQATADGGVEKAGQTLPALADKARSAMAAATKAATPFQKRLSDIRQQLAQLRDDISALKIGKLPFPTRLLDVLNTSLLSRGSELPARHLRELCEVTDERWRPAVEVAFMRKFAVVVSLEHYDEAERIYHQLKPSGTSGDTNRESLINPTKALKLRKTARQGSLAEKLKCQDEVAKAVVNQLFGDLICVERREDMRQHDHAIVPDGFMTRGAFVERTRFYDGLPFIGKNGLQQQLLHKQELEKKLRADERELKPLSDALQSLNETLPNRFDVTPDLYLDLAKAQELPKLQRSLSENITKLNSIDRSKFDELEQERLKLEFNRKELEEERRSLDRSEKRVEVRRLESAVKKLNEEAAEMLEEFTRVKNETDVSTWLKRLTELEDEKVAEFPNKKVAADKFNGLFHQCDRDATGTWEDLKAKRRELATAHPKFDDLPVEAENNDAHEKQLIKLEQSEIPDYRTKAERERQNWERLFRTQILEKLHTALQEVVNLIALLNPALKKRPIGVNTYKLTYSRNPDYQLYHELLEASAVAREDDLFFASADQRFRDAINHFLKTLTDSPDSAEASRLLDYRHYYDYDMKMVEPDGRETSVDRHSGKMSGGENQSPYFIAILASYLRAYRRYSSRRLEPTLGLVPIDEAFSKLSGERIKDCITALKAFDLQGVFSMSTGNIPYAFEHCDWLIIVSKEDRRLGSRTEIRNLPISMARDSGEARRLMNESE